MSQFFKTRKETKAWLDLMGVKKYTINKDLTVDVNGDVDFYCKIVPHFPINFKNCKKTLLFRMPHRQA